MAISRGWSSTDMDKRGADCRPLQYVFASLALWVSWPNTQAGHFALQLCISVSPLFAKRCARVLPGAFNMRKKGELVTAPT